MSDVWSLRELQKIQLMILRDIAKICDENGLKYYLIGGTLLGAVRHEGFIPWDDDVDIVMMRNDYDKLFKIIKSEYSEKYFAQRFESDPLYLRYIMKIRLNGTKHIEERVSKNNMHHGIYIDIFPIDKLSNAGILTHVRGGFLRVLFALKNIKHCKEGYHGIKKVISYLFHIILVAVPDHLINKCFDTVCTLDNSKECEYVTNFASHFKWKKQMYPAEYFGDGIKLKFEGEYFNAPNEYKKILERLYGDFMKIPPKDKQIAHKLIEVDFGKYKGV